MPVARKVQFEHPDRSGTAACRHGHEQSVQLRHIESGARAAGGLDALTLAIGRDHIDMAGAADQQDMAGYEEQIVGIAASRPNQNRAAACRVYRRQRGRRTVGDRERFPRRIDRQRKIEPMQPGRPAGELSSLVDVGCDNRAVIGHVDIGARSEQAEPLGMAGQRQPEPGSDDALPPKRASAEPDRRASQC